MHFNTHLMNFINQIIVYRIGLIIVSKIQNVVCEYLLTEGLVTHFLGLVEITNSNQFDHCIFITHYPSIFIWELKSLFLKLWYFNKEKTVFILFFKYSLLNFSYLFLD